MFRDGERDLVTLPRRPQRLLCADRQHPRGLLKVDVNYKLKPNLAERFETSPDGETWTFHLRQGVKWNDGQPFTSADVKYNLDWLRNPDNGLRRLLGRATLDRFVAGRTSCQN